MSVQGLKPSLGLNYKQKDCICQQGVKTKLSESKKGWQGRGGKIRSVKWSWCMLSPLQTSSKVKSGWIRSGNSEATWDVSQSPGAPLAHEVTLVNVIYSHLCFIMRHTHVGSALLLCWFMIMNFHKKIMEVVWWHRDSAATLISENKNNTTALLFICEVHACICLKYESL